MDQVAEALLALQAAEAGIPEAEEQARQLIADARAKRDTAKIAFVNAIASEYERGARVSDLAVRARRSRETIRRFLRGAGFEAE